MSHSTPLDEKSPAVAVSAVTADEAPASPEKPNLSQAMNNATRDLHDSINLLIMSRFASCLQHPRGYTLYREGLLSYYHIYLAFEGIYTSLLSSPTSMPPHTRAALTALSDARLARAPALAADLAYLFFDTPGGFDAARDAAAARPQVAAYVRHIETVCRARPHTLVAYAHVYYMALFAGGKILRRQLQGAAGFVPVHGPASDADMAVRCATNLFQFPVAEEEREGLRTRFKEAMGLVEELLTEGERAEVVQEAREVFKWNGVLVGELDAVCRPLAVGALGLGALEVLGGVRARVGSRSGVLTMVGVFVLWVVYCAREILLE
ncbi:hypothetical protein EDC01DRAFT_700007 [Geopyxis carbonaria]|nr:hypothetical protein EDC01DRAFT_700007 [Geopyxis carbonaria]